MKKLIQVDALDYEDLWINPDHVVSATKAQLKGFSGVGYILVLAVGGTVSLSVASFNKFIKQTDERGE